MYGYYEEDRCATEAEADQEYALWAGSQDTQRAWILSDRDVWYANPYYTGPRVPHPEDDIYEAADLFFFNCEKIIERCADAGIIAKRQARIEADLAAEADRRMQYPDDEVPF